MSGAHPSLRLDRLLANMGYGSRRDVQTMVRAGLVQLDGVRVDKADQHVAVTHDLPKRMSVNGKPLDPAPGLILMLNKPLGVTCSRKEAGRLVYDLIPERWRYREPAISAVGRLDKETSGLLLMTDDGALLHRIISPKANVAKRYRVSLDRPLDGHEEALFASGTLMLDGERDALMPAIMETLSAKSAYITIAEGRYHQVRRMFAATGNHVVALHRDRVGGLDLPGDLEPGQYRMLGPAEIAAILTSPKQLTG